MVSFETRQKLKVLNLVQDPNSPLYLAYNDIFCRQTRPAFVFIKRSLVMHYRKRTKDVNVR